MQHSRASTELGAPRRFDGYDQEQARVFAAACPTCGAKAS
jgi:hypothetical protein